MKLFIQKIFLILLLSLCILTASSSAVLPPHVYKKAEQESKIKAIAKVVSVKTIRRNRKRGTATKKVEFRLLHKLTRNNIPKTFTGICTSVVDNSKHWLGGTIYYYPIKGVTAYVAVSSDGGSITAYQAVSKAQAAKKVAEFKQGVLLMDQIRVRGMPEMSLCNVDEHYTYRIHGKPAGSLRIQHRPGFYRRFMYDFSVTQEKDTKILLRIETGYTNGRQFRLTQHNVSLNDNTTYMIDASFNDRKTDNSIPEGILRAEKGKRIITSLPENTVTDLMLFEIVKKLPFQKETVLKVNILEACEMNLKKGFTIQYSGKKEDLHGFAQKDKDGNTVAEYRLNSDHKLMRVRWDKDKVFLRNPDPAKGENKE